MPMEPSLSEIIHTHGVVTTALAMLLAVGFLIVLSQLFWVWVRLLNALCARLLQAAMKPPAGIASGAMRVQADEDRAQL
jgi:hypothetical protein